MLRKPNNKENIPTSCAPYALGVLTRIDLAEIHAKVKKTTGLNAQNGMTLKSMIKFLKTVEKKIRFYTLSENPTLMRWLHSNHYNPKKRYLVSTSRHCYVVENYRIIDNWTNKPIPYNSKKNPWKKCKITMVIECQ